MAKTAPVVPATVDSLLQKSGMLIKRGDVWTYPGAENDPSGTNLRMPVEFVSNAVVAEALDKGDLVMMAADFHGVPTSVGRPPEDGQPVRLVNMMQAGSVEAATELPPNSRPTHDAGRRPGEVDLAAIAPKASDPKPVSTGPAGPATPVPVPAAAPAK